MNMLCLADLDTTRWFRRSIHLLPERGWAFSWIWNTRSWNGSTMAAHLAIGWLCAMLAKVGGGYHPNMVVGAKWHPIESRLVLGRKCWRGGQSWWSCSVWDVGVGMEF